MNDEYEWNEIRSPSNRMADAGSGALRIALLFGGLALALAIFVTPFLKDADQSAVRFTRAVGIDPVSVGSVSRGGGKTYTIRKSVLQPSRDAECVIGIDGSRRGEC